MLFADRLYLAYCSTNALQAAVKAGTFSWAIIVGVSALVLIGTVFVAQNNGARRYKEIGGSVWQVIWLAFGSSVLFFFLGFVCVSFFYDAGTLEFIYFRYLVISGSLFCMVHALATFYIRSRKGGFFGGGKFNWRW